MYADKYFDLRMALPPSELPCRLPDQRLEVPFIVYYTGTNDNVKEFHKEKTKKKIYEWVKKLASPRVF
jgi:hypothetical protein